MKPRIAVLGCGYWGSNHIRTLKSLGALQAVADANSARAEGFAVEHGCLSVGIEEIFTRDDIDADRKTAMLGGEAFRARGIGVRHGL
jgi:predicted dehydrogenase